MDTRGGETAGGQDSAIESTTASLTENNGTAKNDILDRAIDDATNGNIDADNDEHASGSQSEALEDIHRTSSDHELTDGAESEHSLDSDSEALDDVDVVFPEDTQKAVNIGEDVRYSTAQLKSFITNRGLAANEIGVSSDMYDGIVLESSFLEDIHKTLSGNGAVQTGKKGVHLPTVLEILHEDIQNKFYVLIERPEEREKIQDEADWNAYAICAIKKKLFTDPQGALHHISASETRQLEICWIIWKCFCNLKGSGNKYAIAVSHHQQKKIKISQRAARTAKRLTEKAQARQTSEATFTSTNILQGVFQNDISERPKKKATRKGKDKVADQQGPEIPSTKKPKITSRKVRVPKNAMIVPKNAPKEIKTGLARHQSARDHWKAQFGDHPISEVSLEDMMRFMEDEMRL